MAEILGGAVIGWKRNGKLIPYDRDLDVKLELKEWRTPRYFTVMERLAELGYCIWYRSPGWTKIWSSVIGVDVWNWEDDEKNPGKLMVRTWTRGNGTTSERYKKSDIYPLKTIVFLGYPVLFPNNPERYLDQAYGKGKWETPLKCTKIVDRKCIH